MATTYRLTQSDYSRINHAIWEKLEYLKGEDESTDCYFEIELERGYILFDAHFYCSCSYDRGDYFTPPSTDGIVELTDFRNVTFIRDVKNKKGEILRQYECSVTIDVTELDLKLDY